MPTGVATGASIVEPERSKVIDALALGHSVRSIADDLGHHSHTIEAVREAEWRRIEQRKPILTAQAERNALLAGDLINASLATAKPGEIPLSVLNPLWGTAIDKVLALRGDQVSTIRHIHSIDIQDDDLVAFAVQRSEKRANARVMEDKAMPTESELATMPNALPCPIAPAKPSARKRRRRSGQTGAGETNGDMVKPKT